MFLGIKAKIHIIRQRMYDPKLCTLSLTFSHQCQVLSAFVVLLHCKHWKCAYHTVGVIYDTVEVAVTLIKIGVIKTS